MRVGPAIWCSSDQEYHDRNILPSPESPNWSSFEEWSRCDSNRTDAPSKRAGVAEPDHWIKIHLLHQLAAEQRKPWARWSRSIDAAATPLLTDGRVMALGSGDVVLVGYRHLLRGLDDDDLRSVIAKRGPVVGRLMRDGGGLEAMHRTNCHRCWKSLRIKTKQC